jgi:hypothetical protein
MLNIYSKRRSDAQFQSRPGDGPLFAVLKHLATRSRQEKLRSSTRTIVGCAAHQSWPLGPTPGLRWFPAKTRVVVNDGAPRIHQVNEVAYAARVAAFKNVQRVLLANGAPLEVPWALQLVETTRGAARIS